MNMDTRPAALADNSFCTPSTTLCAGGGLAVANVGL